MSAASEPKVVVITGASAGVGRATARAFGSLARASVFWPAAGSGWSKPSWRSSWPVAWQEPRAIAVLGCWLLLVHYLDSY
jgi:hypothetical protein